MSITIITGTATDVGKTVVTAGIVGKHLSEGALPHVIKPIQTGEPDGHGDLRTIADLTGLPQTHLHEFIRYPEPLAPSTAARRAGMDTLSLPDVSHRITTLAANGDPVLVEGAGGLLVRMGDWTIADLAVELGAPVIVVTATGLGSLNTAELTVEACRHRGIDVVGLVGGSVPAVPDLATTCNITDLPDLTGVPALAWIPEGAGQLPREQFLAAAPGWFR